MTTRCPASTSGSRARRGAGRRTRSSRVWSVNRPAGSRHSSGSTLGCSRSCTLSRSWSSASARPRCSTARPSGGRLAVGPDEHHPVAGLGEGLRHASDTRRGPSAPTPAGATAMMSGLGSRSRILARSRRMVVSNALAVGASGSVAHRRPGCGTAATTGRPVASTSRGRADHAGEALEQQRRSGTRARARRARPPTSIRSGVRPRLAAPSWRGR